LFVVNNIYIDEPMSVERCCTLRSHLLLWLDQPFVDTRLMQALLLKVNRHQLKYTTVWLCQFHVQCPRSINWRADIFSSPKSIYISNHETDPIDFQSRLQSRYRNKHGHKHDCYGVEQFDHRVERRPSCVLVWIAYQVPHYCDCMSLSLFFTQHLDVFLGVVP
jgi:hypothetical protein